MANTKLGPVGLLILVLLAADRATKLLSLQLARSDGGLFLNPAINANWLFGLVGASPLVIAVVIFLLLSTVTALVLALKKNQPMVVGTWSLIVVGGASNFWDRLWYGGVIDFIKLTNLMQFNLADLYIVGGLVLLMIKFKSLYVR